LNSNSHLCKSEPDFTKCNMFLDKYLWISMEAQVRSSLGLQSWLGASTCGVIHLSLPSDARDNLTK